MPYKVGKKTGKGWQILKKENGRWRVAGHSQTRESAKASIRIRYASEKNKS